jgi:hypothetical protein
VNDCLLLAGLCVLLHSRPMADVHCVVGFLDGRGHSGSWVLLCFSVLGSWWWGWLWVLVDLGKGQGKDKVGAQGSGDMGPRMASGVQELATLRQLDIGCVMPC